MASQGDSSDCDIWDYQPALKRQLKSLPETSTRKTGQKQNTKFKRKGKALSKKLSSNDKEGCEDCKNESVNLQIIDVDLEPCKEITEQNKITFSDTSNQAKSYFCSNLNLSSLQAGPNLKKFKSSTQSLTNTRSSKTMAKKRCSQTLTFSKSRSPVGKSRRISVSPKDNSVLSIDSYFSPKKVNSSKANDIWHSRNVVIDLLDKNFEKEDDNLTTAEGQIASGATDQEQHKQISNDVQSSHQPPLVNVDVIVEGEAGQSSFEFENGSGIPYDRKMDIEEKCYSQFDSIEKGSDKANIKEGTVDRCELKSADGSSSSDKTENDNRDVPSGLSPKESSSETDDLFIEDDEAFSTPEKGKNSEKSGGFLVEDVTTEIISSPSKTKEESQSLFKPSPEKIPLLASTTWPTMVTSASATKQTTLYSFLKAKPRLETAQSNLTKSVSESLKTDTLARTNSFSSGWKSIYTDGLTDKNTHGNGKNKQCPFYKRMPGTPITVDAFRYGVIPGCEAYVLTHFHYDHYGGLTKKFAQPIFCSQVTGNLVESRIGVHNKWINRLPMWKPCKVANATLTLMEANHCPGAVIILFELKDGRKILHTGDFRANTDMESYSALQGIKISELYLDTTYCNPSYAFPDQTEVVHFVVDLVLNHVSDHPSTLIVCGAYTIGKERIFQAIAKALDSKICVMNDKKKVLDCLEDSDLKSRVTLDWSAGRVHVLPMGKLNQQHLREHLARHQHFESILAFQPTGWTHSEKQTSLGQLKPKWSKDGITLYGVPYSEHSSFLELKRFVQHFRPLKILPTVNNGSPSARSKMETIFKEWMLEKIAQK